MTSLRTVLFDFGGVLYYTPNLRWVMGLQRLLRRPIDETLFGLYLSPTTSPYVRAVMTGEVPESAVWDTLLTKHRVPPNVVEWMRLRSLAPRRLNLPMIDLLKSLRPKYKTAVLTNAGSEFRSTFCRGYNVEEWADRVIISAEIGLAKPDTEIYTTTAALLGTTPEECLFVDDMEENVAGALAAGMKAFQFRNNAQATAMFRSFGVVP